VLPAAKQLRGQLASAGVSWTAEILGDYQQCGVNDPLATGRGDNALQYTAQQLMTSYDHTVTFAVFSRQVVEAVNAFGWKLRPVPGPSSQARYYVGQRDGVHLRLVQQDVNSGLGPQATIWLSGSCFDAGSSATDLMEKGPGDTVKEPRPTSTPVPKYS
jgi:hypothetical protein